MRFRNYAELTQAIKARAKKVRLAVVCANEAHTMEAVLHTWQEGLIEPVFIGPAQDIRSMLESYGLGPADFEIAARAEPLQAAQAAVELVHAGAAQGIMKGGLETGQLMRVLLRSENRLRVSRVVCAMSLMEVPHYPKLLAASDPALCIAPSLDDKAEIIRNATAALHNMGIDMPKVAILAAVETPSPKMPETMDALALKEMNQAGEITGCIVDGPLSYDLCIDAESVRVKGLESEVAGDADLIIYPNLVVGNAVSKALVLSARAVGSSMILGTAVPVVLPSRSSSVEEKERNILLAAASVR